MREVVLDTETTGFDPLQGDRLVEIGCIELFNLIPTGKTYHQYINPERDMPESAFKIHGLSEEFLKNHPVFEEIAPAFLDFIADSPLVIHNAKFDMKFLNYELKTLGHPPLPMERAIDTILIARKKFPGAQASLDALCRRFKIDNSKRVLHGALLDCELLAEVYLELKGGSQLNLLKAHESSDAENEGAVISDFSLTHYRTKPLKEARKFPLLKTEEEAHLKMLEKIPNALWGIG